MTDLALADDAGRSAELTRTAGPASRTVGLIYAVSGGVGLVAAFVLLLERLRLLENSSYIPTCSFNERLDCGAVMASNQADAFGFPNPILGVAGFPIIITAGVGLLAGAAFPRWYRRATLTGVVAAAAFVHWLIFQSVMRIGALCPYCMVVWAVTIAIAWYTIVDRLSEVRTSHGFVRRVVATAVTDHAAFLAAWYLAIAVFTMLGM